MPQASPKYPIALGSCFPAFSASIVLTTLQQATCHQWFIPQGWMPCIHPIPLPRCINPQSGVPLLVWNVCSRTLSLSEPAGELYFAPASGVEQPAKQPRQCSDRVTAAYAKHDGADCSGCNAEQQDWLASASAKHGG